MDYLFLAVCGSRTINDYEEFEQTMLDFLAWFDKPFMFVHGAAKLGIDAMVQKFADDRDWKCVTFEADWDTYGKSAGYRRNADIREVADYTLAIWDGVSNGTADMINNTPEEAINVIFMDPNPSLKPFFYSKR